MVIYLRFKIKNCEFVLDYTFVFLLSLASLFGAQNAVYALLFSFLHEGAHILCLLVFNNAPARVTLSFYGIGLKFKNNLSPCENFIFLCSGFMFNLAAAVLFLSVSKSVSIVNFILFLLNSYPLLPLDGGRALRVLIYSFLPEYVSRLLLCAVNSGAYFFLAFASVLLAKRFSNYSLLVILIYISVFNLSQLFKGNSYDKKRSRKNT